VAPAGNQPANRDDKHEPKQAENPVYSTSILIRPVIISLIAGGLEFSRS